jgi:hypothetical protein
MKNSTNQTPANNWLSVPLIATITRLLCRELTFQNKYLRQENKILKSKIKKRLVFTDDERRTLVETALEMDRDLMAKVVAFLNPKRFLRGKESWKTKVGLFRSKEKNPGMPRRSVDIEQLVCQMARENEWGYE